jgi:hypothetical protein
MVVVPEDGRRGCWLLSDVNKSEKFTTWKWTEDTPQNKQGYQFAILSPQRPYQVSGND